MKLTGKVIFLSTWNCWGFWGNLFLFLLRFEVCCYSESKVGEIGYLVSCGWPLHRRKLNYLIFINIGSSLDRRGDC